MLLDTDVLIDLYRLHPPAVAWFSALSNLPGVPGFSAMELLDGCRNKMEWRQVDRLLSAFLVYWPTDAEMQQCMKQFTGYRLAHNLGILDALIAVTAVGRGEPLATFNVRHYRAVSGLMIVQPYTR